MSSIEERLAADIAAVTRAVVMTESDLREARDSVDQRIDNRQQVNRRRTVVAAAAAAVVIPILGVAALQTLGEDDKTAPPVGHPDDSSAVTADRIEGVWRRSGSTDSQERDIVQLRFGADGTFAVTETGELYSSPMLAGDYAVAGNLVTVTVRSGTAGCAGEQFVMQISQQTAMQVYFTEIGSDECAPTGKFNQWTLQRALPTTDQELLDFGPDPDARWQPATPALIQPGDWLAVGGGHVLELAPGGGYVMAAGSGEVVDSGQWAVTDARELQLISGSDSPTCEAGDRLVLGQLAYNDPGAADFMRGTTEQNTCGGAWTPADGWYRLPSRGSWAD